jgi:hypothetical protein
MEKSSGDAGETTSKPSCTAESSRTQPHRLPRYCRYIDFKDLERWEAAGWRATAGYKRASDDIDSIIIGWFEDGEPVCPNPNS